MEEALRKARATPATVEHKKIVIRTPTVKLTWRAVYHTDRLIQHRMQDRIDIGKKALEVTRRNAPVQMHVHKVQQCEKIRCAVRVSAFAEGPSNMRRMVNSA